MREEGIRHNMSKQSNTQEYALMNKVLVLDRVSKTTDGGRNFSFRAAAVVGDGKSKGLLNW